MFTNERQLASQFAKNIRSNSYLSVKDVTSGNQLSKAGFENVLSTYFDNYAPSFMARPDIILIADDIRKVIDERLLVAIELKYFIDFDNTRKLNDRMREAFREIGQPLRYYLYGFDSAILWHVFERDAEE